MDTTRTTATANEHYDQLPLQQPPQPPRPPSSTGVTGTKRKNEQLQETQGLIPKKSKRSGRPPSQVEPTMNDVFCRTEQIAEDPEYNVDDDGNELTSPPPSMAPVLEGDGITVNPNANYQLRRGGRADLEFRFLNFRNREDQELLTDVKGLVIKQLPNMPPDYVIKIVYNIEFHETIAAVSKVTGQLLGIICYRKFREQHFIEIVFCAVLSTAQFGGIGKSLMTRLKDKMLMEQYYHFITCADVEATGYFEKMGFSKDITLDPSIWKPRIKDYVSTVLMHCEIVPRFPVYKNGTTLLKAQYRKTTDIMEAQGMTQNRTRVSLFQNGSRVPIDQITGICKKRKREREREREKEKTFKLLIAVLFLC